MATQAYRDMGTLLKYSLFHAIERNDLAGRNLTEYLRKLFNEISLNFRSSVESEKIRDFKEKLCSIAADFELDHTFIAMLISGFKASFRELSVLATETCRDMGILH